MGTVKNCNINNGKKKVLLYEKFLISSYALNRQEASIKEPQTCPEMRPNKAELSLDAYKEDSAKSHYLGFVSN